MGFSKWGVYEMVSSADGELTRWGVSRDGSSGDWHAVYEKRSSEDGEFTRCGVQQIGCSGDGELRR